MNATGPALPYPDFPLRPHKNGQWFKSIWNPRTKKSEQFYFGSWHEDPRGECALRGWLSRKDGIRAGVDHLRVTDVPESLSLGELMARFLSHKRQQVSAGDLSKPTLAGYLREVAWFVEFMTPTTPIAGLKPEHFAAYMKHLVEKRKLGRFARKRVRTYVTTFLRYGAQNDWYAMPRTGTDWVAPARQLVANLPDPATVLIHSYEYVNSISIRICCRGTAWYPPCG